MNTFVSTSLLLPIIFLLIQQHKAWADFEMVTRQIQDLLCVSVSPAMSTGTWNRTFLTEYFETFK